MIVFTFLISFYFIVFYVIFTDRFFRYRYIVYSETELTISFPICVCNGRNYTIEKNKGSRIAANDLVTDDNKHEIINSSGNLKFIVKNLTINDNYDYYVESDDDVQRLHIIIIDRKYCVIHQ